MVVSYKIEKYNGLYYARVYSSNGFLLDSIGYGSRADAKRSLQRTKDLKVFEGY